MSDKRARPPFRPVPLNWRSRKTGAAFDGIFSTKLFDVVSSRKFALKNKSRVHRPAFLRSRLCRLRFERPSTDRPRSGSHQETQTTHLSIFGW